MKKPVLFLCTGNSCRSQMAEGFLRHFAGDRFDVASAGTRPAVLNPGAIDAMREVGVDIAQHRSKSVDEFAGQRFDHVITVCDRARESCPIFPGPTCLHQWSFDDPAEATGTLEERMAVFRRVRDEIAARIRRFLDGTCCSL
ncbi:MAG: arsenate reductase ArsC [Nitrospiraceae bacterium]|nr:MAG: arsenate reductase ArsC [Nitrospiraceae bacterium]